MNKILTFFWLSVIFSELSSGAFRPDCKNFKQFNYDSFVCVCTQTKPCDQIKRPVRTRPGVVTRWVSSRDGARLRKQTAYFGQRFKGDLNEKYGQLVVKVNRFVKHQRIFGFGGSFTDSTGINIQKLGPILEKQMLRDYFSKDGLEYNVGRIPIGGTDFSTRPYTYDDYEFDKTLRKFSLTKEDFKYKIPIIKKAKSLATHEIRLFGSPWSAPAWMKTNNDLVQGGSIIGPVGSEFWQIWAKYFVRYLNAYKAHNITHWGITIQNEPAAKQTWNSMIYSPEMMRDFLVTTLGPELKRSGWVTDKLKVIIWDHNLDQVQEWVRIIFADRAARKYASGTGIHWYSNSSHTLLDKPHRMHPDKFILATEACVEGGVRLGSWMLAERYAYDILQDLLHHVIGWVDWNLVLDTQGGPNWVGNFVDAPLIIDTNNHQYYRQPHYYAMAHFSKFLPPGSVRIDSKIVKKYNSYVIVGAFRTPYRSTVVIAVNNYDQTVQMTIYDQVSGYFMALIEPRSIHTYVYYD